MELIAFLEPTGQRERLLLNVHFSPLAGANYSRIIDEKFHLNGRYRRAWSLPLLTPSPGSKIALRARL